MQLGWDTLLEIGHWKNRLIYGISLVKDNIKSNGRGNMSGPLVEDWTLERQTYSWDKSGVN